MQNASCGRKRHWHRPIPDTTRLQEYPYTTHGKQTLSAPAELPHTLTSAHEQQPAETQIHKPGEKDKMLLECKQCFQAEYYNRCTHNLPALTQGEVVKMRSYKKGDRVWEKGVVNQRLDKRSYMVEILSGSYRRNRRHLQRSPEQPQMTGRTPTRQLEQPQTAMGYTPNIHSPSASTNRTQDTCSPHQITDAKESFHGESSVRTHTRTGRGIRRPAYLKEYTN